MGGISFRFSWSSGSFPSSRAELKYWTEKVEIHPPFAELSRGLVWHSFCCCFMTRCPVTFCWANGCLASMICFESFPNNDLCFWLNYMCKYGYFLICFCFLRHGWIYHFKCCAMTGFEFEGAGHDSREKDWVLEESQLVISTCYLAFRTLPVKDCGFWTRKIWENIYVLFGSWNQPIAGEGCLERWDIVTERSTGACQKRRYMIDKWSAVLLVGGGFKYTFIFTPNYLGKWSNLMSIFFKWVGSTTKQCMIHIHQSHTYITHVELNPTPLLLLEGMGMMACSPVLVFMVILVSWLEVLCSSWVLRWHIFFMFAFYGKMDSRETRFKHHTDGLMVQKLIFFHALREPTLGFFLHAKAVEVLDFSKFECRNSYIGVFFWWGWFLFHKHGSVKN